MCCQAMRCKAFSERAKRFLALFAPIFFIPYLLATHFFDLSFLNNAVADVETRVLNYFGFNAWNNGELIFFNGEVFRIVVECTGFVMTLLFLALVVATGISNKNIVFSIALGIPFLLFFNLLRLAITLTIGSSLESTEAVHSVFWFLDGGIVLLAWLAAFKYDAVN